MDRFLLMYNGSFALMNNKISCQGPENDVTVPLFFNTCRAQVPSRKRSILRGSFFMYNRGSVFANKGARRQKAASGADAAALRSSGFFADRPLITSAAAPIEYALYRSVEIFSSTPSISRGIL